MTTTSTRPLPRTDDSDTGGFWHAAGAGELSVQVCTACNAVLHLPRPRCHSCGSWDTEWRPTPGTGRLYSWTTVERSRHPAFPAPYTIVLVELDATPGARLLGLVPGAPELAAGAAMRAELVEVDGVALPRWTVQTTQQRTCHDALRG